MDHGALWLLEGGKQPYRYSQEALVHDQGDIVLNFILPNVRVHEFEFTVRTVSVFKTNYLITGRTSWLHCFSMVAPAKEFPLLVEVDEIDEELLAY